MHEAKKARGEPVHEILDWSSLIAGTRVASGLDGFDSSKVSGWLILYICICICIVADSSFSAW